MLEKMRSVNPKNADLVAAAMRRPSYLAMAMDAVANDGGRISEAAIDSALDAVRADLVSDERARTALEIEQQKQRFESESILQRIVNKSLSSDRDELARKLEGADSRTNVANLELFNVMKRRYGIVYNVAIVISHFLVISAAAGAAVVGTDAFDLPWPIKAGAALVAAVLGLYGNHKVAQGAIKRLVNARAERSYKREARKVFAAEIEPRFIPGPLL
jgi:hypothetical protein